MQLFDTSTAAIEPPFGDKHGKSLARLERGAVAASRAEVLTNTGRCSCPFVASGVLARCARAGPNSCSLRLVLRDRSGGVARGTFRRVPKLPTLEPNSGGARQHGARPW